MFPLQTRVDALVYAYRTLGHTIARLDPLAEARPQNPLLSLRELGFSDKDLDMQVSSKFFLDGKRMTLREMIAKLESIYADTIGTEFMHIQNTRIRNWVRHRLESRPAKRSTPDGGANGFAARVTGSGIVRGIFASHAMSAKNGFPFRAPNRSWSFSIRILQKCPGRRASKKSAWAWRIAAASMCSRIFCASRSR